VKKRQVVFAPEAKKDLFEVYDYLARKAGASRALTYCERIEAYCRTFAHAGQRGRARSDIRPGLRVVSMGRNLDLAFHLDDSSVTIDRILYGRRNMSAVLSAKNRHQN